MHLSYADIFFWIVFPYICLTIFVVGNIVRYNTDQIGWTSKSSQLLERNKLKWGSILFHYGIIFVFFGHVAGILIPEGFFDLLGINDRMYHFGAVWFGIPAGVVTLVGGILLFSRRVGVKRILKNSTKSDIYTLLLLVVIVGLGIAVTVYNAPESRHFDYREYIGPWFRGLLIFQPDASLMVGAPFIFKIHIFLAFLLFAIWPFTRLVHVWSLPLEYLNRRYVTYRKMTPPKIVNRK